MGQTGQRVRWARRFIYGCIGLVLALLLANCTGPGNRVGRDRPQPDPLPAPLPAVAELPEVQLPDWIEHISPTGEADRRSQIRIRFAEPLIPVEALESPERNALLDKFKVFPEIPGQFRFLTPRMVGFQADRAIPQASRLRVTLQAGLGDLAGHRLEQDLTWTFTTEPIALANLPGQVLSPAPEEPADGPNEPPRQPSPIGLEPTLAFTANVPLDLASLQQHLSLVNTAVGATVPVRVVQAQADPSPIPGDRQSSPSRRFAPTGPDGSDRWTYHVTPKKALDKATGYRLEISPGLQPAGGNLPTQTAIASQVQTYAPLAFQKLERLEGSGRFADGLPQLTFNNGLRADSANQHISISPAPKDGVGLVRAYDDEATVTLNPWALEPQTSYQIILDAALEDRFGQTLGETVTLDYTPGDLAPEIWAPTGLNVFPANQDLQLNFSAVNLPDRAYRAAFKVVQPQELIRTNSAYPQGNGVSLLPDPSEWTQVPLTSETNAIAEIPIPLREQLGGNTGLLAYGMSARTRTYTSDDGQQRWQEPNYYGLVQLTNLGVFSQWFPQSGLVRVNHLDDGTAVAGATVEIYRSYVHSDNPPTQTQTQRPCAQGKTGANGQLNFGAADLKTCMGGSDSFEQAPELLAIAREGSDWAHVHSQSYSGTYGYGIYAGWDGNQPQSRGTVFSDRFLYQPGESAWLTGTAYYLQQGKLRQDKNKVYSVQLMGPEGSEIDLGSQTTNSFGTFSLQWPVPPDQPLGYYTIQAKSKDGVELQGELRVANFKPPNFQVDLSLDQPFAVAGQTLQAQVQSDYLFGAPVQNATVNYYVTRRPATLELEGWEGFTFGPQWYWPEEQPVVTTDVLETQEKLGDMGQGSLAITLDPELPYPMTYRIDAEVVDASNLAVADSQTLNALPSDTLIGLKHDFVSDAGKAFEVEAIALTPEGQAKPGQSIRLALERINYSSVTQVREGSATPKYQVDYEPVAEQTLRSGPTAKTVKFTPETAGTYRIRATLAGQGAGAATDSRIWVSGDRPIDWGSRYNNNRLEVKLDKATYAPGETATALIQSPYEAGELYFAVVRRDRLFEKVISVKGGAPQVQFTVTPEMLPNAAIEAVLVRQGAPVESLEPGSVENLMAVGFEPFAVDLSDQYLTLSVTPEQAELRPASEQRLKLALKDRQGKPVPKGQFTLLVVDEAVLQLSGHRPPDLVKTVYAEQDISTRFADNRPDVVLQTQSSPLEKGWGYGGGFSAGGESTRIRRNFLPLAYYNGSVLTDARGEAQVSFELPDNLTTWRAMALATDGELHFATGDATFVTTQPLVTAPVLPQFARPGDRLSAGLSVTQPANQAGASPGSSLTIDGTASQGLQFVNRKNVQSDRDRLKTTVKSGTQVYRFPLEVTGDGPARLQFQTQLGDQQDAFELPLDIVPLAVTEQVVEAGSTADPVTIPLKISPAVTPGVGGLEILLSSTVLSDIQAPVKLLGDRAPLPNLSDAASRLKIAANLQILSQRYGQGLKNFDSLATAQQALDTLKALRRPDGGFSSWPGFETSDPFATPYAAEALGAAKAAGIPVDGAMVSALQVYLAGLLNDPDPLNWCNSSRCRSQIRLESLGAIAALGSEQSDFLADLYDQRAQLDVVGQIQLARHLSRFANWQSEADSLFQQLQATVSETARSAVVNLPAQWGWFHSPVATQAQMLQLAIARGSNPELLQRLTDGLLALRRDGTWQTIYDNAQALSALSAYAQQSPEPPNFTATVQLGGKQLASQAFKGYQQPSLALSIPMADLAPGESSVALGKTGQGLLHYLMAYRYRPEGLPPGRLQGLRVTRSVRPVTAAAQADEAALYQLGLSPVKDPLKLEAGQVFDIGLEIIADHPVHHVIITDPLPAGLEAVDTSFQTSNRARQAQQDSWEIGYQQLGRDRILAYADQLEAGVYNLHYLVRAVTPGRFLWPGSEVQLEHAPEEFGRTATATLEIAE